MNFESYRVKLANNEYLGDDCGGVQRKSRKKNSEALLQGKINLERHSPGKKEIFRGHDEENFFIRKGFSGKNKFISKISSSPPDH